MDSLVPYVDTDLTLYCSPSHLYLLGKREDVAVQFDRQSGETSLVKGDSIPYADLNEQRMVKAFLGMIELPACPYLVVATDHRMIGFIDGDKPVFQITRTEIVPFTKGTTHLSSEQQEDNRKYLSMLKHMLDCPELYYSAHFDITHTMQRLNGTSPGFLESSLVERADDRFVWNAHLLRPFMSDPNLHRFLMPIINGYINISQTEINGIPFRYILISRRCNRRAGARLWCRGGDNAGNAANYIESEQIVETATHVCSYVIIRGSIPLLWTQEPAVIYKPKMVFTTREDGPQLACLSSHFMNDLALYSRITCVNLVNKGGNEGELAREFNKYIQAGDAYFKGEVLYDFFDFHHECSKMRWHNLSKLINRLDAERQNGGFFQISRAGRFDAAALEQRSVFRVNCVDCLDRTNVVCSLLCLETLQDQLRVLKVLSSGEKLTEFAKFQEVFRETWLGNANAISVQYAGTGALKTDFTRTGKRTTKGAIDDGINSARRYFLNNFYDGFRQDAYDLFLGVYQAQNYKQKPYVSPFEANRPPLYALVLPSIGLICLAMMLVCILIPAEDSQLVYILFWGVAAFSIFAYIYTNGSKFVDRPKLTKLKSE